jgi:subtilisin
MGITNNMDIINMSLGGSQGSSILEEWCNKAYNSGILLIASAGKTNF